MPALVHLLIFTIFMAAPSGAYLLREPPTTAAELKEQQHMAETMEKGIQEYRNLMVAIRKLKNTGLMGQLAELVGRDNQEVFDMDIEQEDRRACGKKLADKLARLCIGTCTGMEDISTQSCAEGLTDSDLIAHCCPHSPREALPKHFVF